MYTLRVEGAFEAAHRVVDYPGKCDRLHGHNWVVEAVFRGQNLDALGILIDFDHAYLNELPPFCMGVNPTAENLARIIFERLAAREEIGDAAMLSALTVWESPKSSVTYTKD